MIENKCIIQIIFMPDAGKLFDTLKLIFSTQTWQTVGWSDFGDNNKIVNSASSAQLFWDPSSKILKSCFLSWCRNLKWAKHLKKGYSIFKSKNLKETKFFPLSQNKFLGPYQSSKQILILNFLLENVLWSKRKVFTNNKKYLFLRSLWFFENENFALCAPLARGANFADFIGIELIKIYRIGSI